MRVAYLSHSLVAERQQAFGEELRCQLTAKGGDLLELYPMKWGQLSRSGGWPVSHEGDMTQYLLPLEAWQRMIAWRPDVLLLQQEAYCLISQQAADWCRMKGVPLVTFNWENLTLPPKHAMTVFRAAAVNIFGNHDAERLAQEAAEGELITARLPQVGIDPQRFRPSPGPMKKTQDICFFGRKGDPMKGEPVLDKAAEGQSWKVWKRHEQGFFPYELLPQLYAQAVVQCVPSLDVAGRPREQFAPAVSVESLLCAVPVVTTSQSAIVEWTGGLGAYVKEACPAAWWAQPGEPLSLMAMLQSALHEWRANPVVFQERALKGREWAMRYFSNERVASEYVRVLKEALA